MDSPAHDVRGLLRAHGIRPKKDLGQNFLVNESYLRGIVQAAVLQKDDEVLEIGAGIGTLTRHLALAAGRVCAVEIDERLFPLLENQTSSFNNVILVKGDILQTPLKDLVTQPGYKVVANIPYYLTSNLVRYLLESPVRPAALTLTMQKEVAERICADAGRLSLLALSVQVFGSPRIALEIPAIAFYPPPKVDSATLAVDLFEQPLIQLEKMDLFFRLIKAGFAQKRKMLRNTLSAGLAMESGQVQNLLHQANIDPRRRAQTMTLEEWRRLVDVFENARLMNARR
jgi:16S rRNA (adenine1518-N6/adenine1519-N6)-dimethyltransferase